MKLFAMIAIVVMVTQTLETEAMTSCSTMFRGKKVTYPKCAEVAKGAKVYWRVKGKTIFTLLEAKSSRYFGFGWGFNQMIGSTVKVLYVNGKKAQITTYMLNDKKSSAVVPVGKAKKASVSNGLIAAVYKQKIKGVVSPGKLNFAIWCHGKKPKSPPTLSQHKARGVISVNV